MVLCCSNDCSFHSLFPRFVFSGLHDDNDDDDDDDDDDDVCCTGYNIPILKAELGTVQLEFRFVVVEFKLVTAGLCCR